MEHRALARFCWLQVFGALWYSSDTRESKVLGDLRKPAEASTCGSGGERGRTGCLAAGAAPGRPLQGAQGPARSEPGRLALPEPGTRLEDFGEAVPGVSFKDPKLSLYSAKPNDMPGDFGGLGGEGNGPLFERGVV